MIKITSFSQFVDVARMQDYATTDGLPGLDIQLNDSPVATTLLTRFQEIENKLMDFEAERQREKDLIENTPALKEIYDQYRVILALVKEQDNVIK